MFKFLKRLLAIILIVIAVICFILASIVSLGLTLPILASVSASTWVAIGCLSVAVAYLVDSDVASRYVAKVGKGVGDIANGVGSAIASGVRGLVKGSGIVGLLLTLIGGYALYSIWSDKNDN